jgi:hypothetical protein
MCWGSLSNVNGYFTSRIIHGVGDLRMEVHSHVRSSFVACHRQLLQRVSVLWSMIPTPRSGNTRDLVQVKIFTPGTLPVRCSAFFSAKCYCCVYFEMLVSW